MLSIVTDAHTVSTFSAIRGTISLVLYLGAVRPRCLGNNSDCALQSEVCSSRRYVHVCQVNVPWDHEDLRHVQLRPRVRN